MILVYSKGSDEDGESQYLNLVLHLATTILSRRPSDIISYFEKGSACGDVADFDHGQLITRSWR